MKNITIISPFCFKTSLELSLELTLPLMSTQDYEELKSLIMRIPNVPTFLKIELNEEIVKSLIFCIAAFKNTKTFLWIRDDFSKSLLNIERQCLQK